MKFVNAKPVYFPPMANNASGPAIMEAVRPIRPRRIRDKDGSLGGGPNSYVLINDGVNDSIAVDAEACEIKPTWNAAVCKGDVGRLNFGGGGGGGSAALVAQVLPEAQLPVLAQPLVPAAGARRRRSSPALAQLPVLAHLVVEAAVPAGPAQPPVVLSRNGKEYTVTAGTNVRAGTEIKVTTERPSVSLTLTELDSGSWVIFELPGFTTAASGTPQDSLDALRKASDTSYFKDKDALWVKVVSSGDPGNGAPGGGTSLQVSR